MKARIHEFGSKENLRIEVTAENNDERMLLRAFLREHAFAFAADYLESDSQSVTFGLRRKVEQ